VPTLLELTACNETIDRHPTTNLRLNLIIEIDRHNIFCIAINPLDRVNSVARSHHSIDCRFDGVRSRARTRSMGTL
jgi:hypothetical protein